MIVSMTKKTRGCTASAIVSLGIANTAQTQESQKIVQASLFSLAGFFQAERKVGIDPRKPTALMSTMATSGSPEIIQSVIPITAPARQN